METCSDLASLPCRAYGEGHHGNVFSLLFEAVMMCSVFMSSGAPPMLQIDGLSIRVKSYHREMHEARNLLHFTDFENELEQLELNLFAPVR